MLFPKKSAHYLFAGEEDDIDIMTQSAQIYLPHICWTQFWANGCPYKTNLIDSKWVSF